MKRSPILIAIGTMLLMTACSDDYFNKDVEGEYSDYIGYSVKVNGSDEFQSRSAVKSPTTSRLLSIEATEASIGGRQLFLHTEIIDSIPQTISRAKCDDSATASRGTVSTTASVADDGLSISAVVFDGDATDWPGNAEAQMYMHNDIVISPWKTNRYWPRENDWIRFYAFSPIDALGNDGLGAISATEPSFSYTVNGDITKQQDLLVGSEQYAGNKCETAQIDLGHALTAVKILIDGNVTGFVLTKLYISGLKNSGTYTYHYNSGAPSDGDNTKQTHDAGAWTSLTGNKEYVVYNDPTGKVLTTVNPDADGNATGNTDMTANEENMVMFLMPQTLTTDAKITIEGYDEVVGTDVKLEATIGDGVKKWNKGEMVTYTLSFDSKRIEYHLNVQPIIADADKENVNEDDYYMSPYHGEIGRGFTVECYKQTVTAGGAIEEGPIALDWAIDESTRPWWVDHITASGKGPGTGDGATLYTTYGTYSVLPNLTSSTSHNELRGRAPLGSEDNPYDLSTLGGTEAMTTANCYMVTAPGWYTFPLVYGNAFKKGSPYPESFMGDTSGLGGSSSNGDDNALTYSKTTPLYDVDGTKIKDISFEYHTLGRFWGRGDDNKIHNPWVVKGKNEIRATDGRQPTKSKLLQWQDEPCLISNVKLNDNEDYVIFYVNPKTINEGNALIAVRDSLANRNQILWSWHIWVTDQINRLSGNGTVDFSTPTPMTNRMVTGNFNDEATNASDLGHTVENRFHLMQSPIGGCDADTKTYTEAVSAIRFRIMVDGEEFVPNKAKAEYLFVDNALLKVGVQGGQIEMRDNAPYYQFGRKDPMLPGWPNANPDGENSFDKNCKPFFKENRKKGLCGTSAQGANSENCDFEIYEGSTIGFEVNHHVTLIGNPMAYFCGEDHNETNTHQLYQNDVRYEPYTDDIKNFYINKWNATCNKLPVFSWYDLDAEELYNELKETIDQGVVKTVYDPSPRGYEVPRIDAFAGTTYYGSNFQTWYPNNVLSDYVNVANVWSGDPTFKGLNFYTLPIPSIGIRTGDTFYIPALGYRNNQGDIAGYNDHGSAFTASPICAQWYNNGGGLNMVLFFQGGRFTYTGIGWIRPFSSSDFDLAFPVIPASTGQNPISTVIDGNASWSGDGNKDGGYNVEF